MIRMNLLGIELNPLTIIVGMNVLLAVCGIAYVLYDRLRVKQSVYCFSESEALYDEVPINGVSSVAVYNTKQALRFIRTGRAYKNRLGNRVIWLAKRGTAYLMKLEETEIEVEKETNEKDEDGNPIKVTEKKLVAKKLGTLWEGLESILGTELVEQFTPEVKAKLIKPFYWFTVELEKGKTPEGMQPLDENDVKNETSMRMSELIFAGVKQAISEDYIKSFGLIAVGVALTLLLQNLGVLNSV